MDRMTAAEVLLRKEEYITTYFYGKLIPPCPGQCQAFHGYADVANREHVAETEEAFCAQG